MFPRSPMRDTAACRGANIHWPLVSRDMGIPYIGEKLAILGAHRGLWVGNGIGHEVSDLMMKSYYPRMVARHALGAVVSHYEEGLYAMDHFRDLGRDVSSRAAQCSGEEFPRDLLTRTFGVGRAGAILSGIDPPTRSRYESGWKHWQMFPTGRNKSPWITRSGPNWGDNMIDFLMSESRIIGNASPTIRGNVSTIRFWHVIVGYPDFSTGGVIHPGIESFETGTSYSTEVTSVSRHVGVAMWNLLRRRATHSESVRTDMRSRCRVFLLFSD